jgi:hypothetical protein
MFRNPDTLVTYQPSRAFLKQHFRMAVLLDMKARVGYPEWDKDMPKGFDQIAKFTNSEEGKLRFETILVRRFNSFTA